MLLTANTEGWAPRSEKRVTLQCDLCGTQTETSYANYKKSQEANGSTGQTKCKPCAIRQSALLRRGKPAWNKGTKSLVTGSKHPSWNGGRYIDAHGYVMIHQLSGRQPSGSGWAAYRKEHIVKVEQSIGRSLAKGEIVHHIDGDRQNNDLEANLWLSDNAGHRNAHQSLQEIGYELVKLGLIKFDKTSGKYMAHVKWGELLEKLEEANQQPS